MGVCLSRLLSLSRVNLPKWFNAMVLTIKERRILLKGKVFKFLKNDDKELYTHLKAKTKSEGATVRVRRQRSDNSITTLHFRPCIFTHRRTVALYILA